MRRLSCPLCRKETGADEKRCRHCGFDLGSSLHSGVGDEGAGSAGTGAEEGADFEAPLKQDEDSFSDLDYRPRKKTGCLLPASIIVVVLIIVAAVLFVLPEESAGPAEQVDDNGLADDTEEEQGEEETEETDRLDPGDEEPDPGEEEPEAEEEEELEDLPDLPDHDRLEADLHEWLVERTEDPSIILLAAEELEDFDQFFAEYDLETENIIVYIVEAEDGPFLTLLFGPPFSEWTLRATFYWDRTAWVFIRESTVR